MDLLNGAVDLSGISLKDFGCASGSSLLGMGFTLLYQWFRTRSAEADATKAVANKDAALVAADADDQATDAAVVKLEREVERMQREVQQLGTALSALSTRTGERGAHLTASLTAQRRRLDELVVNVQALVADHAADQRDLGKMLAQVESLHAAINAIRDDYQSMLRGRS